MSKLPCCMNINALNEDSLFFIRKVLEQVPNLKPLSVGIRVLGIQRHATPPSEPTLDSQSHPFPACPRSLGHLSSEVWRSRGLLAVAGVTQPLLATEREGLSSAREWHQGLHRPKLRVCAPLPRHTLGMLLLWYPGWRRYVPEPGLLLGNTLPAVSPRLRGTQGSGSTFREQPGLLRARDSTGQSLGGDAGALPGFPVQGAVLSFLCHCALLILPDSVMSPPLVQPL